MREFPIIRKFSLVNVDRIGFKKSAEEDPMPILVYSASIKKRKREEGMNKGLAEQYKRVRVNESSEDGFEYNSYKAEFFEEDDKLYEDFQRFLELKDIIKK